MNLFSVIECLHEIKNDPPAEAPCVLILVTYFIDVSLLQHTQTVHSDMITLFSGFN